MKHLPEFRSHSANQAATSQFDDIEDSIAGVGLRGKSDGVTGEESAEALAITAREPSDVSRGTLSDSEVFMFHVERFSASPSRVLFHVERLKPRRVPRGTPIHGNSSTGSHPINLKFSNSRRNDHGSLR